MRLVVEGSGPVLFRPDVTITTHWPVAFSLVMTGLPYDNPRSQSSVAPTAVETVDTMWVSGKGVAVVVVVMEFTAQAVTLGLRTLNSHMARGLSGLVTSSA